MPSEKIMILDDRNFEKEVERGDTYIVVQFWAPWSPPCRQVSAVVDTIADEFDGRIIVGRLNVDNASRVIDIYRVSHVPTLILFKAGGEVYRKTGAINESTLSYLIEEYFGILNR